MRREKSESIAAIGPHHLCACLCLWPTLGGRNGFVCALSFLSPSLLRSLFCCPPTLVTVCSAGAASAVAIFSRGQIQIVVGPMYACVRLFYASGPSIFLTALPLIAAALVVATGALRAPAPPFARRRGRAARVRNARTRKKQLASSPFYPLGQLV